MPIELLHPSPNNPRKHFTDADLDDLARSIREKGLLQPLVVRARAGGDYEIVAGERRWRAAQRAGIHEIPVLIRELSDGEALEIALIENIQRSDLNPLEEARAYNLLLEQFNYTQQQLAESVGKSRSHIANTLRLLNLPDSVRQQIESGKLTAGHARTLVATDSPSELAEQIIQLGLSVREAETLTRDAATAKSRKAKPQKDADTKALEKAVGEAIGLKVEIHDHGAAGGRVTITYKSLEQLEEVCKRLQSAAPRPGSS
jgi:ParB family transcriptional regulator, chromosome partitioning protein